jgi:hypothetical protein
VCILDCNERVYATLFEHSHLTPKVTNLSIVVLPNMPFSRDITPTLDEVSL